MRTQKPSKKKRRLLRELTFLLLAVAITLCLWLFLWFMVLPAAPVESP